MRVISIGRNIGSVPMDEMRWRSFVGDLCALVRSQNGQIVSEAWGTGYWEGQSEDTFLVVFDGDEITDLPLLAFMYEQEAIASFHGEAVLWTGLPAS